MFLVFCFLRVCRLIEHYLVITSNLNMVYALTNDPKAFSDANFLHASTVILFPNPLISVVLLDFA